MISCKKCGQTLKEDVKFCGKCGTPVEIDEKSDIMNEQISPIKEANNNSYKKNNEEYYEEESEDEYYIDEDKPKKNKFKIIIFTLISLLTICIISGTVFFMKLNSNSKEKSQSIDVVNLDATKYPNISITIKANNYPENLKVENFTLKEKDAFQKDLKLNQAEEENQYIISYKSSDESTSGERKVKIAYLENGKESIAETSYPAPEKSTNNSKVANSKNAVNTYDKNEVDVKQAMDNYEDAYIRMVNSKDTYYIKDAIDLSGGLLEEFNTTIKSYSEQKIDESLLKHNIENIKKITDTQYEVTTFERYHIYYGEKRESKNTDFRTIYIVNKTSSGFKIYAIKKTDNLGSN